MSQVTKKSDQNGKRVQSKSEGDSTTNFVSQLDIVISEEEHDHPLSNIKNGHNGSDSPMSDFTSSGIHSKSTSPDSAATDQPTDEVHSSESEVDEVFHEEKSQVPLELIFAKSESSVTPKQRFLDPLPLNNDNIDYELSTIPATPTKALEIMGIHRIYMKQFSDSSTPSSSGVDNLAYIEEEREQESGNRKEVGGETPLTLSNVAITLSMKEKCRFENAHRKCIRDMRKMLQATVIGQKGIPVHAFIEVFYKKELLRKLFDLFDYKQKQELNQEEWIELLKSRLDRGERQVDFVDLVESVAYAVCGEDNVQFEQFCAIFRTRNVLNKLFRLIDRDLDGVVTAEQIMDFIAVLSTARTSNRLTKESVQLVEDLFRQCVGPNNEFTKEDFKKIIQTKNQFFTDRLFDIFDEDRSGSISLQEFIEAMHQFAGGEPDDKLRFLFRIYDVDGDGSIQCEELGKVMRACMEESGMNFSDDQIHELTMALFEDADVERLGTLTFEALKAQLKKHDGLLENLSISIDRWLIPPKPKESDGSRMRNCIKKLRPHQMSFRYLKNNYIYLSWLFIFILTNISLFVSKCWIFQRDHPLANLYLMLARGAGQCLNFNCTFIVILMLKQSLTYLRSKGASSFLPIDQSIYFHKLCGYFIFFFAVLHTVMHLINIEIMFIHDAVINSQNWTYFHFLFAPDPTSQKDILNMGLVSGYAFNTGVALIIILTIMIICSLPFVRRGGCFEVFYWTHLLYFAFWILLIIHAPNFWKFFFVPGFLFLIEKVVQYYNWKMGRGRTCVSSGILLPSKVTHLIIRRPQSFEFHPGDYVFIRIPDIAKYEWHPFTISSAPEQSDAIWLHIRAAGEWTTKLYEYFENEQKKIITTVGEDYYERDVYNEAFGEEPASVDLISDTADMRSRLPTVGVLDSQETIDPTSVSSIVSGNKSGQELSSSVESENDAIIKNKKVPIRCKPKTQLTSTKSLPNVNERLVKREVKLNLRNSPQSFHRSLSVNEEGNVEKERCSQPTRASISSPIGLGQRNNRVPRSLRYMRNKPTIISLKTPSYEYGQEPALLPREQNCGDNGRLAEEGRTNFDTSEVFDNEANETHPIMGTTITTQGSHAVGRPLEVFIDGPFGASSSEIFRAEHAVLIATGIGVTPFASILQSIMHRYWATRVSCPRCRFTWCKELPESVINLKKVDFFWINRDQRSFEWFVHLLSQLEIEQAELGGAMERFLDMHMYITSALQKTDMKAVGLQLALDLLHEREKRDLITGLKTKTHAGRPNWSKVFQHISNQKKGKVTVFYCGPPALARTLKMKCDEFGFSFRKELF